MTFYEFLLELGFCQWFGVLALGGLALGAVVCITEILCSPFKILAAMCKAKKKGDI